jgi:hypothetical protein
MTGSVAHDDCLLCRTLAAIGLVLALSLGGCAEIGDGVATAFADPAKYDLYECKQLEAERKSLANRAAELQGLMAKAETGVAGPVVAELAYRNDYVAVRGQAKFAEDAWRRNKCQETTPVAPAAASPSNAGSRKHTGPTKPSLRSGNAVY